jgi:hypothetical protein
MNEVVIQQQPEPPRFAIVPVAEIQQRMAAIKQLIQGVMKENVDFGVIPGTGENARKVLLKPGAEKICAMFRIAVHYDTQDLSRQPFPGEPRTVHYRVVARGVSPSGEVLGEGMGECSTDEEKFRWRRAVCDEEFQDTPETQRRIQYKRGKAGSHYKVQQIMTNAADSANTILKMAAKRAMLAMTLNVTGCSDDFAPGDYDDSPITPGTDDDRSDEPPPPRAPKPKGKPPTAGLPTEIGLGERKFIERKIEESGEPLADLLAEAKIESLNDLTPESFAYLKDRLK